MLLPSLSPRLRAPLPPSSLIVTQRCCYCLANQPHTAATNSLFDFGLSLRELEFLEPRSNFAARLPAAAALRRRARDRLRRSLDCSCSSNFENPFTEMQSGSDIDKGTQSRGRQGGRRQEAAAATRGETRTRNDQGWGSDRRRGKNLMEARNPRMEGAREGEEGKGGMRAAQGGQTRKRGTEGREREREQREEQDEKEKQHTERESRQGRGAKRKQQ